MYKLWPANCHFSNLKVYQSCQAQLLNFCPKLPLLVKLESLPIMSWAEWLKFGLKLPFVKFDHKCQDQLQITQVRPLRQTRRKCWPWVERSIWDGSQVWNVPIPILDSVGKTRGYLCSAFQKTRSCFINQELETTSDSWIFDFVSNTGNAKYVSDKE